MFWAKRSAKKQLALVGIEKDFLAAISLFGKLTTWDNIVLPAVNVKDLPVDPDIRLSGKAK